MPKLNHIVDTLDEIAEPLREHYAEADGKFYLQVEGLSPKSIVNEFRENNIQLLKENDTLKATVSAFGDVTPERLQELQRLAENGGTVDEKQIEDMVNERVSKRTKKMSDDYENQLKAEREAKQAAASQLSTLLIDNGATQAAVSAGVRDSAIPDVIMRARSVFQVKDGKAIPLNGDEIVYGKDGQTPQTMNEWLAERVNDSPHWFKEPAGGGSRHKPGASGANAPTNDGKNQPRGMARMRAARS